ncbi:hypothetical protein C8Q80DRAFT_848427 [Daedaleopsis nitida]|nr:hypothetical protein C8Q80DRAFT_848427 [Daedaleopsis nitida]
MSNHQHPDDHFHYGCFPRVPRRGTPTGATGNNTNNNNTRRGLFHLGGQGGRAILPPLHLPFRTSRSPGLFSFGVPFIQDPTQTHPDPTIAHFNQPGWQANQVPGHQQAVTPFPSDPRYPSQQATYGAYPSRTSPNMMGTTTHDSRILPPLNMPQSQIPPHIPMTPATQVRSPPNTYSAYYAQADAFSYGAPDARHLPPPVQMPSYDMGLSGRRPSLVDRSNPRPIGHGSSPYPRVPSAAPHVPEPPIEPVKKKRKRADAEQLKVLNETYNRTAFPSTEERIELAKKLGMSARSVQIWFQNKRQAMRQSSRQAAANAPPTTSQPYAASSHSAAPTTASLPPAGGYAGHPSSAMGPSSASQAGYGTSRPPSGMGGMHTSSGRLNNPSPSPSSHRRSHEDDPHARRFSPRGL